MSNIHDNLDGLGSATPAHGDTLPDTMDAMDAIDLTMPSPVIGLAGSVDNPINLDLPMDDINMTDLFGTEDTPTTAAAEPPSGSGLGIRVDVGGDKKDVSSATADLDKLDKVLESLGGQPASAVAGPSNLGNESNSITGGALVSTPEANSLLSAFENATSEINKADPSTQSLFGGSDASLFSGPVDLTSGSVGDALNPDDPGASASHGLDPFDTMGGMGFDSVDFSSFLDNDSTGAGMGGSASGAGMGGDDSLFGMAPLDFSMDMPGMDFSDLGGMGGMGGIGGMDGFLNVAGGSGGDESMNVDTAASTSGGGGPSEEKKE